MRRAAKISCTNYSIKTKAVNVYLKFLRQTAKKIGNVIKYIVFVSF